MIGECEECGDGKFKDKNKNECTESIPDGNVQIQVIVIEDDEEKEYKVYDKCYETCLHCNKPSDDESNQECTLCRNKINTLDYENDLYIRVDTTNCETTCDDDHDNYYVKDDSTTKCINCKKNSESTDTTIKTKVYHYIDENECIVDPGNGYYLIDSNTGTIGHCYERCLTCIKAEEYEKEGDLITDVIKTHNCDSCKSEYVQYGKECLNECPEKLVNVSKICKNCKTDYSPPQYNYENNCVISQPDGTDIVDEDYNYVESCGEKCATCKIVDTTINCYTCKSPFYKKYNSEESITHYVDCERNCDKYLVKDDTTRECINCKENTKYYYNHECVDINDGNHHNYYISEEDEEEPYGVIKKCDDNCAIASVEHILY